MSAKFEFEYCKGVSLKYLSKILNDKKEYYDVDIEIIKLENTGTKDGNERSLYDVLYKGRY